MCKVDRFLQHNSADYKPLQIKNKICPQKGVVMSKGLVGFKKQRSSSKQPCHTNHKVRYWGESDLSF